MKKLVSILALAAVVVSVFSAVTALSTGASSPNLVADPVFAEGVTAQSAFGWGASTSWIHYGSGTAEKVTLDTALPSGTTSALKVTGEAGTQNVLWVDFFGDKALTAGDYTLSAAVRALSPKKSTHSTFWVPASPVTFSADVVPEGSAVSKGKEAGQR